MGHGYSLDLRERIVARVQAGHSRSEAARILGSATAARSSWCSGWWRPVRPSRRVRAGR